MWRYKEIWERFSGKVGFWADMEHPYITCDDNYIESEWWALKEIWNKDLLYKGFKVVPYCPHCGTPLSSHEVAQGYKAIKDRTAIVRFRVKGEEAYFLAWTTTPWTLPSNIGLCVNPHESYVKVKAADGNTYYLAEALLEKVLGEGYEILERYTGKELEHKPYEPLYSCAAEAAARQHKEAFFVYADEYVTMTDGTGIVHIAPAFGEDDARVGRRYDAPFVQMVDDKGKMKAETGKFAGMRCKPTEKEIEEGAVSADPEVLKDLEERGLLFASPKVEHDYPHCWRCGTPLIYYARESWFIKMTAVRDDLVRNNQKINWVPQSIGEGRFGNWIENIQDWAVSRNRYWGTPLNIWECPDCGEKLAVGSREELAALSGDESAKTVELHRPYVDRFTIPCPKCSGKMKRVPEVVDVWFDSGACPYAELHYPFENKELLEQQLPASFISEAVDQTRGWFYSLHAESTLLFNKPAFTNVIVMGLVLDENGNKMSKSKGNAVDPMEALDTFGADAIRWYFYTAAAPWLPKKFSEDAVREGQRKFLGTLWNTYAFYVLYADIDRFDPTQYKLDYEKLSVMDKWLLSKMNSMVRDADKNLAAYKIPETAAVLQEFVDDMSNWYVRRCRNRFWAKGMEQDKINAFMTLYTALVTVAKAAAPMIPFMSEQIYQNLVRTVDTAATESVHLCDYPVADEAHIDAELEKSMDEVLKVVVLGRSAREASGRKNRQPLSMLYVKAPEALGSFYQDIIRDELNVKALEFTDDAERFVNYLFKPQLKTVGPKYGKHLNAIKEHLKALDGQKAMAELNANGSLGFTLPDGTEVSLCREDLLIESAQSERYVSAQDNGITVVLDIELNEALIEEGFVRELISKVQTMRKDAGFEVTDHIVLNIRGNAKIAALAEKYEELLKNTILSDEIHSESDEKREDFTKEWNLNGELVTLSVRRVKAQ